MEYAACLKLGTKFKKELNPDTKKHGFYDWQFVNLDDNKSVMFEFFWNYMDYNSVSIIHEFMKNHEKFNPRLMSSKHDNFNGVSSQIMLTFNINTDDFN